MFTVLGKNVMIEKLRPSQVLGGQNYGIVEMAKKVNELVDAFNGKPARILVCPHCGSEEWEDMCSSTLMGGPRNYHTYTCRECHKNTKVLRIEAPRDHKVYLGPKDEVTK
jgi:hypothetical protein